MVSESRDFREDLIRWNRSTDGSQNESQIEQALERSETCVNKTESHIQEEQQPVTNGEEAKITENDKMSEIEQQKTQALPTTLKKAKSQNPKSPSKLTACQNCRVKSFMITRNGLCQKCSRENEESKVANNRLTDKRTTITEGQSEHKSSQSGTVYSAWYSDHSTQQSTSKILQEILPRLGDQGRKANKVWPLRSKVEQDQCFREMMRLSGIYYQFIDGYLSGLQFCFSNGEKSDKIQVDAEERNLRPWEHVDIDPRDILTHIEANLDGNWICCLKLRDRYNTCAACIFDGKRGKTDLVLEIPKGQDLIGFQAMTSQQYLTSLSFLSWVPNLLPEPLSLEPPHQSTWNPKPYKLILLGKETYKLTKRWPITVEDYKEMPLEKRIKLCRISIKSLGFHERGQSISAIQLHFTNGVSSPLFQSSTVVTNRLIVKHEVEIDTSKTIASIQVTMGGNGRNIQRLGFFDKEGTQIADCSIYKTDRESQNLIAEVAKGHEIIGLQTNTEQPFIHTLGFIAWRPNKHAKNESYRPIVQSPQERQSKSLFDFLNFAKK